MPRRKWTAAIGEKGQILVRMVPHPASGTPAPRPKGWLARLLPAVLTLALAAPAVRAETLVLAAADTRPTAYLVDGRPEGVLVELVQEMCRRAGYSVEIRLLPWARCLLEARDGKVDGVFSSFRLPEREPYLAFPKEALTHQDIAFFVRSDSPLDFHGDLGALGGVGIAVITGTSYGSKFDSALRAGALHRVAYGNSIRNNLRMLVFKRVDMVVSYRQVALDAARDLGLLARIRELSPPVETVPSYLAFTRVRDFSAASAALDAALAAMKKDGAYDRIVRKYGD
jgi:polar amino acid transport system substrate-binding protein